MQLKIHMVTIEDLMPQDHFLRKLEKALDLSFVYEETRHLYSQKYGRPPIDPVVLVKYLLVGFLYGIPSERQIEKRIETDIALRWYLGLDLLDRVPDHSTISQLRRRKPEFRNVFRRLFHVVVQQCIAEGLVTGKVVATDSTHMKANASVSSECLVEVQEGPEVYWERLNQYEEQGLEKLKQLKGKRRAERKEPIKKKTTHSHKRVSRTDPEAGHMKRPGKPEGPYYLVHETLDTDHGIILAVTTTAGNVYDSVPYLDQIEDVHKNIVPVQIATADSAYDFALAHQVLDENGISFFVRPKPNTAQTTVEFDRTYFSYDSEKDVYICPNQKELHPRSLVRRDGGIFWKYWASRKDCKFCPLQSKCLTKKGSLTARYLWDNYFRAPVQKNMAQKDSPEYRKALKKRQIWCEGTFAAQKWSHNLKRLLRRGLEAATDHCLLSATAINLKRMIKYMG